MKNLSNFDAFKLNKGQMNAVSGGQVICYIHSGGDSIRIDKVAPGINASQAGSILLKAYPWADSVACTGN